MQSKHAIDTPTLGHSGLRKKKFRTWTTSGLFLRVQQFSSLSGNPVWSTVSKALQRPRRPKTWNCAWITFYGNITQNLNENCLCTMVANSINHSCFAYPNLLYLMKFLLFCHSASLSLCQLYCLSAAGCDCFITHSISHVSPFQEQMNVTEGRRLFTQWKWNTILF